MDILHEIYNSLSTRELASITLLGLFLIWSIHYARVRVSVLQAIKILFSSKVLTIILMLYGWIFFACYIMNLIGIWDNQYIKDVILFALSTIPILIKITDYKSQQDFGILIIEQIKYTAFISVYLNLYTLGYLCEILLQFSICIIVLMKSVIELQNEKDNATKQLYGCLNKCNIAFGYFILLFLLYQTCIHPLAYTLEMILIGIALPFIFTIIVTPYLYCFTIYGSYEMWFTRLKRSVCDEKIEYVKRRNLLIRHCGLNLRKLKYFEKHIQLFMIRDYDEFLQAVHICELGYRKV